MRTKAAMLSSKSRGRKHTEKSDAERASKKVKSSVVEAVQIGSDGKKRCFWCPVSADSLYAKYHDEEWGVPVYDDQQLFEMLVLESAQAGLSWSTILNKRENYRRAFDQFDIQKVALYGDDKISFLLSEDSGIVRNRAKVLAAINAAKLVMNLQKEFGSFSKYIWSFVPEGKPIWNELTELADIPTTSVESEALSRDLKQRGFRFVGPTTMYAFMQAVGMVQDHFTDCFRYPEMRTAFH
jgi:DNA-3-methyladenine glycosylase I